MPVVWNEFTFGGGLNEEEEQDVVDARHDWWMYITDIDYSQAHLLIQKEITRPCHVRATQNPSYGERANLPSR